MAEKVTIRRDTFAIPHVIADDEGALFFGHGCAQAEQRPTPPCALRELKPAWFTEEEIAANPEASHHPGEETPG